MWNSLLRLLLAGLIVFLPSCVTGALWEGKLRGAQVIGESWTAPVQDGILLVDVENGQLWTTLLPEGRPPVCCRMRAVAGSEAALRAVFPGDATAECSCELEITRELHDGVGGENPRGLLTVQPGGTMLAVEVQIVDGSEATAGCRRYPLPAVIWNEVAYQTGVDVFGITWRVAATPFTLVTDAVLLAPGVAVLAVTAPFRYLYYLVWKPIDPSVHRVG